MASSVDESVAAAKRSELEVLWGEICVGNSSSTVESRPITGNGGTSRLYQLVKELRSIVRERSPSYIDNLPNELLNEIFLLILSPLPLNIWEETLALRTGWGALDLSTVCKRWQAVMLSDPSLWTRLIIGAEPIEPEYLQIYFHLSRDRPLTLYLIAPNHEVLSALQPQAHRIQHLYNIPFFNSGWRMQVLHDGTTMAFGLRDTTLRIPTSSIVSLNPSLQIFSLEVAFHFQNLQQLVVRRATNRPSLIPEHVNLPHLRVLILDRIRGESPPIVLKRFLVQKLQVLHFAFEEDMSYEEFTSLQSWIYQIPGLTSVTLHIHSSITGWAENPPPLELSSSTIREVELEWAEPINNPLQLLEGIRSLEILSLKGPTSPGPLPKYCLPASLRGLELYEPFEGFQEIQEISLPYLEKLKLDGGSAYGDHLLRKLFAPSLIRLEIPFSVLSYPECETNPLKLAAFAHAHGLQHLNNMVFELEGSGDIPPFPQLRTLRLKSNNWRSFTLLEAPKLLELTVAFWEHYQNRTGTRYLSGRGDDLGEHQPLAFQSQLSTIAEDETDIVFLKTEPEGAPLLGPTTRISPPLEKEIPPRVFHKLTNLSFEVMTRLANQPWECELPDGFDILLDKTPALQKILLPAGRFPSNPDEAPIDRLARKILEQPSFCLNLQDIGSSEYPTDWVAFLRMLASRCITSLSSSTGLHKSVHTLRFHLLPHPHIVQQLEGAMTGRRLTPHYFIPPCDELCIHSWLLRGSKAQGRPKKRRICFMCHKGRLETGCPYGIHPDLCLKWVTRIEHGSMWEVISG